jgi:hypothetical protein
MGAVGSIVRGVEASAFGTLAMDTLLYRRYQDGGGDSAFLDWESSDGVDSWDEAPAPALAGRKLIEGVTRRQVPARYARLLNNVMHWGLGLGAGAGYGLVMRSRRPRVWYGVPFGAAVWVSGYVVLPRLGVYKDIWKYDLETLEQDLSAHLVFGTATAAVFWVLWDLQRGRRPVPGRTSRGHRWHAVPARAIAVPATEGVLT